MCDPGYRRSNRDCYKCPRNTYSAGGNVTTCKKCPDKKYSSEGSSTCSYVVSLILLLKNNHPNSNGLYGT